MPVFGQWSTNLKERIAHLVNGHHYFPVNCSISAEQWSELSTKIQKQPPSCVFILFIHVEKSGGSTWTSIFQNRTLFHFIGYHGGDGDPLQDEPDIEMWEKGEKESRLSWGTVKRALASDDEFIRKHPRLVMEVHAHTNVRALLDEIESWGHRDTAFRRRGCRMISFMSIREPLKYLRSHISTNLGYFPVKTLLEPDYPINSNPDAAGYRSFIERKSQFLIDLECRNVITYLGDEGTMAKVKNISAPQLPFDKLLPSLDKVNLIGLTSCHSLNILVLAHSLNEPELLHYSNLILNARVRTLPSYLPQFMQDIVDKSSCDKSLYSYGVSRFRKEMKQRFDIFM